MRILWPHNDLLALFEDQAYPMIQQMRLIKKQNANLARLRDLFLPN